MIRLLAVLAAVALGAVVLTGEAARADQKDARLGDLFARLKTATGYLQGRTIEQQIWEIWMESDDPEVSRLMGQGIEAMNAEDYQTALADFTKITQLAPDFAEGWNKRATVLYLVGDYQGSLADVDTTLKLEPRHFGALSGLGLIDAALERDEEAITAFERALAVNPNMPGVTANVERLKQRLKDKQI
jgi:tetratricopeptide (TPR) repeat protein